jgi:hypothetical protein
LVASVESWREPRITMKSARNAAAIAYFSASGV